MARGCGFIWSDASPSHEGKQRQACQQPLPPPSTSRRPACARTSVAVLHSSNPPAARDPKKHRYDLYPRAGPRFPLGPCEIQRATPGTAILASNQRRRKSGHSQRAPPRALTRPFPSRHHVQFYHSSRYVLSPFSFHHPISIVTSPLRHHRHHEREL